MSKPETETHRPRQASVGCKGQGARILSHRHPPHADRPTHEREKHALHGECRKKERSEPLVVPYRHANSDGSPKPHPRSGIRPRANAKKPFWIQVSSLNFLYVLTTIPPIHARNRPICKAERPFLRRPAKADRARDISASNRIKHAFAHGIGRHHNIVGLGMRHQMTQNTRRNRQSGAPVAG